MEITEEKTVARPHLPWTFLMSLTVHLLILFLAPTLHPGLPGGVPGAQQGYAVAVSYLGETGDGGPGNPETTIAGTIEEKKPVTEEKPVLPGKPAAQNGTLTSTSGKAEIKTPVKETKPVSVPAKTTGNKGTGSGGQAPAAPPGDTLVAFGKPPVYPKNAANEGVEGTVELVVWVNAKGETWRVDLAKSSGDARLDMVAQKTVINEWRFKPQSKDYRMVLLVEFKGGEPQVKYGPVTTGVTLPAKTGE